MKQILISQPAPPAEKNPYTELTEKYGLKLDFKPFITIVGVTAKEFRAQRVEILANTAVIFTTRTGIDHFFRICEETRVTIPETMKYFCISEAVALYLQKYTVYRKRKIFFSQDGKFPGLIEMMNKHKDETFLFTLSDVHKDDQCACLQKAGLKYTKGVFYRTVSSDFSNVDIKQYDILAFYSPQGILSLIENYPTFEQGATLIAAFGPSTADAVVNAGLRLDISAPNDVSKSMAAALELYFMKQKVAKVR